MLTLNQIVSLISNFATLDYRVNDFFFGDIWEYATKKGDKFPVMLCTLKQSRFLSICQRYNMKANHNLGEQ